MAPAQDEFNKALQETNIKNPSIPVIGNVSGKPLLSIKEIQEDLQSQLTSPVRWTDSINFLLEQGIHTIFEIGTGNVLSGLIRRISKEVKRYNAGTPQDIENMKQDINSAS